MAKEYIEVESAIDNLLAQDPSKLWDSADIETWISKLPVADVVEVKRGEWIHDPGDRDTGYGGCIYCSECYLEPFYTTKTGYRLSEYCPNCGAKMTEES